MIYDCALPIASLDLIYCIYILFDKFFHLKKLFMMQLDKKCSILIFALYVTLLSFNRTVICNKLAVTFY